MRDRFLLFRSAAVAAALATVPAPAPALAAGPLLAFEANLGQADGRVAYLARGSGGTVFLTDGGATLAAGGDLLRIVPAGGRCARPEGVDRLPGTANYFRGADPALHLRDVPTFSRVRYRDVWPGIDLFVHGDDGLVEIDWVVAPGADPSAIAVELGGSPAARLGGDGDLVVETARGTLRLHRPVAFQESGSGRVRVASSFRRVALGTFGIAVGAYDRSRPLVVDPVLEYASPLGGSGRDAAWAVARDAAGNVYVAGETSSTDFPGASGGPQGANAGGVNDAFVLKLDPTGTTRLWATYLGGRGLDVARALAVDGSGGIVVGGETSSTDFPGTASFAQPANAGQSDGFVARLPATGNAISWATYVGGTGGPVGDRVDALAVDAGGGVLVAGRTDSTTGFPVTAGAPFGVFRGGDFDAFVVRIASDGTSFTYGTYLGGDSNDAAFGIAVDSAGRACVTGGTRSPDFPITPGTAYQGSPYQLDAFLAVIAPEGNGFADVAWSTFFGGTGNDRGNAVAADVVTGLVTLAGQTASTDLPTRFAIQPGLAGGTDGFVARFDPAASGAASLVYSTYLGGSGADTLSAVALDASGRAAVAGETTSADLATVLAPQRAYGGAGDALVAELSPSGGVGFLTYLGGPSGDAAAGIASRPSGGQLWVAGRTAGSFPTRTPLQPAGGGASDAFLARIGPDLQGEGEPTPVPVSGSLSRAALAALIAGAGLASLARRGTTLLP
jgi:hypothetical protein